MAISAQELSQIQADLVAQTLDKACQMYAPVDSVDSMGSPIVTYPTLTQTTVCNMRQPNAGELQNYGYAIEDKDAWTIHLPYGTTVGGQWQLVIEGQKLTVHILLEPHSVPGLSAVIAAQIK